MPADITARCPGCGVEFNARDLAGLPACPVCGRSFDAAADDAASFGATDVDKAMAFRNPANGHVERIDGVWAWVLLLGCIYFAAKGVWTHAVAALLAAVVTGGLSWFVYPFFAGKVMRTHYLRKGWVAV
jgi:hypothetical protein